MRTRSCGRTCSRLCLCLCVWVSSFDVHSWSYLHMRTRGFVGISDELMRCAFLVISTHARNNDTACTPSQIAARSILLHARTSRYWAIAFLEGGQQVVLEAQVWAQCAQRRPCRDADPPEQRQLRNCSIAQLRSKQASFANLCPCGANPRYFSILEKYHGAQSQVTCRSSQVVSNMLHVL